MEGANPTTWLKRIAEIAGNAVQASDPNSAALGLIARHGEPGREFARLAMDRGSSRAELFEAKNSSLSLSLDAAISWSALLYAAELALLERHLSRTNPSMIIDAGCEQGLVSCFAAWLLPTSEIIGFDRCPAAIDRATELASLLGLANVRFEVADAGSAAVAPSELVICSRLALGEAIELPVEEPPELLAGERQASAPWQQSASKLAASLASLVAENGRLLSLERCDSTGMVRWAKTLAMAGLDPLAEPAETITVDEPGFPDQRFSVLIAQPRSEAGYSPPLRSLIRPRSGLPAEGPWHGEDAEAVALGANLREVLGSWQWVGSSGETEHAEMQTMPDGRALELHCSTNGGRSVWIHQAEAVAEAIERLKRSLVAIEGGMPDSCDPILNRP
jgi:hypothetical protein